MAVIWARSDKFLGWKALGAAAAMYFASPFAGMYVTRFGARKALAAGGTLYILCPIVGSFHIRLWELYLAYSVLFGLGGSLCGMLAMTTIVCIHPYGKTGQTQS